MMHRGAIASDGKSGDGSGLLLSMPKSFMEQETKKQGIVLPNQYAVAMVFTRMKRILRYLKSIAVVMI